jgi:hypothetical protein
LIRWLKYWEKVKPESSHILKRGCYFRLAAACLGHKAHFSRIRISLDIVKNEILWFKNPDHELRSSKLKVVNGIFLHLQRVADAPESHNTDNQLLVEFGVLPHEPPGLPLQ